MAQPNSTNVFNALVTGGISAPSAIEIANALNNKNAVQTASAETYSDATNKKTLRLITANARRYDLTNLDFRHEQAYQSSKVQISRIFTAPAVDHPYKDSQPQLINSPLSASPVAAGPYLQSTDTVTSNAVQSTVSLKFGITGGDILRLNKSSQAIDAVPILVTNTTNIPLSYAFTNTDKGIELVISGKNMVEFTIRGTAVQFINGQPNTLAQNIMVFQK